MTKLSLLLILSTSFIAACGPVFDNTIFEANRAQRADNLAGRACDRYATCNSFAAGEPYQTRVDCVSDYKSKALTLWPSDKCGSGQINDGKFDICSDRVDVQACSKSFWDTVAALADCNAASVCSDPRGD